VGGVNLAAAVANDRSDRGELAAAFAAARVRLGLVVWMLVLAAGAWSWTAGQMAGMDSAPGADLGALGWFLGVWVVMMAAMMFPSLAPTVALYTTMTKTRSVSQAVLFTSGYLLVWGAAGLAAYALFDLGRRLFGEALAWPGAGRWMVAAVLGVAALYELTPLKNVCLTKCRSPLGFLLGTWRDGRLGALKMGSKHAGWCLGCCWALMAALFALGVMSLVWMAFVAALIAIEKIVPWRRTVTLGAAAILLMLAVAVLVVPHEVPGFVVPSGAHSGMQGMEGMR
jgi:hypothetical protein